jgi:hypothetical protein
MNEDAGETEAAAEKECREEVKNVGSKRQGK